MDLESGLIFPRVTTVTRNSISNPSTGRIIFNIDVLQYQYWNGATWQPFAGGGAVSNYKTTADGTTTAFTFSGAVFANTASTLVSVNGLLKVPTTDYTATGSSVTFTVAPVNTAVIDIFALGQPLVVPSLSGSTGNTLIWGASFPTTGTWKQGDLVFSTGSTAGGNVGWTCTVAGTPGTWKSFGTISA